MKNFTMTNVTEETTHTTAKELDFIEHLGEHSENRRHKLSRKQLLLAYIEAARLRSRWGDIKPHMVLDRAYELIAEDHEPRSLIGAGVLTNGDARTFPL